MTAVELTEVCLIEEHGPVCQHSIWYEQQIQLDQEPSLFWSVLFGEPPAESVPGHLAVDLRIRMMVITSSTLE